jgi:V8-like Glu-specific endopeptidase
VHLKPARIRVDKTASNQGVSMARIFFSSFLITFLFTSNVFAGNAQIKVIYGVDDRMEPYEASAQLQKLAQATAAMVPKSKIKEHNSYESLLGGSTLEDMGICSHEAFAQQPTAANCSGFLVDEDTLVTAGHCIKSQYDCDKYSWVFDYKVEYGTQSEVVVEKSKIYECASIVEQELDSSTQSDFAVLKLKKKVQGITPLQFRTKGKPKVGDKLVVIGHPSGLPTKVAPNAKVREINDVFLNANLDTYGGNSGSAVFNQSTGVIEGILVRGARDYVYDSSYGCRVSNVIDENAGRGEDVTLITIINSLKSIDQSQSTNGTEGDNDDSEDDQEDEVQDPPLKPELPWWLRWLLGL